MNPKEFEELLKDTEVALERLKALYEQYFQGIERLEPLIPRKEVERRMQRLRKSKGGSTILRFRFQSLVQRYTTYQTYWRRVARQIEEGTYRRDIMRARRRREDARKARHSQRSSRHVDLNLDDVDIGAEVEAALADAQNWSDGGGASPSQNPSLSPFMSAMTSVSPAPSQAGNGSTASAKTFSRPAPAGNAKSAYMPPAPPRIQSKAPAAENRSKPPPVPPGAGKSQAPNEARMRSIYNDYVEARRKNNERTDNVSYESLRKSVHSMLPKLQQKYRGRDLDFDVVVSNGRVGLKPTTKK